MTKEKFVVVEVDFSPDPTATRLLHFLHGDLGIIGRNLVAVVRGELHTDGERCEWCENLTQRCKSRRKA